MLNTQIFSNSCFFFLFFIRKGHLCGKSQSRKIDFRLKLALLAGWNLSLAVSDDKRPDWK